ncbi:patatin-like phospholipase family protein [Tahibacter sp.]|uniref:patatin-like phospholipase family protein n=1 Tax=Tahibacter sp. TaxID=2056211 RepID=UPI0028C47F80|nr:patatin-like phospholipase family protein [Tahibacter sp.]
MKPHVKMKYCDLVMKGGIASGIVYPNAVLTLADEYRFKNIGGTSAGAIAAAVTAAAAVGDRLKSAQGATAASAPDLGFDGLRRIAGELSTEGFIYGLFQPARGAKAAYRLLVTLTGKASVGRKLLHGLLSVLLIAPGEAAATLLLFLALGSALGGSAGLWAALLPSLLLAYLAGVTGSVLRVARVVRRNLLGICSGMPVRRGWFSRWRTGPAKSAAPALTDWMHGVLQILSGKRADEPLTFADLWNAARYEGEPPGSKAINLQMITTGVSHHEPRTLPFAASRFWFRREEFDLLFPRTLVDWMVQRDHSPMDAGGRRYYRLPPDGDLPVLVAMRMSLSFPVLISAVPLHEPTRMGRQPDAAANAEAAAETVADDTDAAHAAHAADGRPARSISASTEALTTSGEAPAQPGSAAGAAGAGRRIEAFRVCWFSDGGISSNFPIHLFDSALPCWPTFALNLRYPKGDASDLRDEDKDTIEDAIFLPTENNQGWQRIYNAIDRRLAVHEVGTFLFSIISTMQNWRDILQSRAPGHRDRIVHISLSGNEGGLNLDMKDDVLKHVSAKGAAAGRRLLTDFSFDNHYWIRWRNLASALQRYTIDVAVSDTRQVQVAQTNAVDIARTGQADPPSYRFRSNDKRDAAQALYGSLVQQGTQWNDPYLDLSDGAPRPLPQLRITPIY